MHLKISSGDHSLLASMYQSGHLKNGHTCPWTGRSSSRVNLISIRRGWTCFQRFGLVLRYCTYRCIQKRIERNSDHRYNQNKCDYLKDNLIDSSSPFHHRTVSIKYMIRVKLCTPCITRTSKYKSSSLSQVEGICNEKVFFLSTVHSKVYAHDLPFAMFCYGSVPVRFTHID